MTYMNALQGVDMLLDGLHIGMSAIGRRSTPQHSTAAALSQIAGATVVNARRRVAEQREQKLRIEAIERHIVWLKSQERG